MTSKLVCGCGKGYASHVDGMCKFCRESAHASNRRERLALGIKHRGDGLPLMQLNRPSKVRKMFKEAE